MFTLGMTTDAAAADFTWTGAHQSGPGAGNWSNSDNWQGNVAPSGNAGTLTFPRLTAQTCMTLSPSIACDRTVDDIGGLTAAGIVIDNGSLTGGLIASPQLYGSQTLNLGSGGITASTSNCPNSGTTPVVGMPIVLTAAQTWSITGCFGLDLNAGLGAGVTGSNTDTLGLIVTKAGLGVSSDIETGTITISGGGGVDLPSIDVGLQGRLNATNGHSVMVTGGSALFSTNGFVGPLTLTGGSFLSIGVPCCGVATGKLNGYGTVTLDSTDRTEFAISMAGTTAGTDYGQLDTSTHNTNVALAGTLELMGGSNSGCPTLNVGDTDTIVQAGTGSVTGTFSGVPDNTIVPVICTSAGGQEPAVQIHYTSSTVTATVVNAQTNALTVTKNGSGSGSVKSSPAGIDCGSICAARFLPTQSITLTATPDAGSTFAGWSGGGCSGTCTVAMSANQPVTATFNKPSGGGGGGGSGGGGGGSGGAPTATLAGAPKPNANGVTFKLSCSASGGQSCQTTDTLTSTETLKGGQPAAVSATHKPKKVRKRTVVVGAKTVTIAAGATRTITITLNGQGRRLLKRFHRLPVTLTIILVKDGKTTQSLKRKLTVKQKK